MEGKVLSILKVNGIWWQVYAERGRKYEIFIVLVVAHKE